MITREDVEREYKHGDLTPVEVLEDLERIGYGRWAAMEWLGQWDDERAGITGVRLSEEASPRRAAETAGGGAAQEGGSRSVAEDQSG